VTRARRGGRVAQPERPTTTATITTPHTHTHTVTPPTEDNTFNDHQKLLENHLRSQMTLGVWR